MYGKDVRDLKIQWNGAYMADVLALPAAVADEHLRMAGRLQLKVLLWYARHFREPLDLDVCAADLGADPEECEDAIRYWVEKGIFTESDATPVRSPAVRTPLVPEVVPAPVPVAPRARPAAVKPQMHEVTARMAESAKFAELVDTVSARLGRPLSGGDMETLLYLYDTAGLPAEVIIMIVNWAVTHGKGNIRYIEKMALDWVDRGIVTMVAAEELLCRQDRQEKAFEQVAVMLELAVPRPSAAQRECADRWLNEWKCTKALLREAYARTAEKTGKFQAKYMDRILEGWHEEGITAPEQLEGASKPTKTSSLDTGSYEELLTNYVPTYPTKE